jgi:hypothetical protein
VQAVDPTTLGAELIRQLATQGLGWLVAALAFVTAFVFYRQAVESAKNCAAQQEAANQLKDQIQEKRLEEARGYIRVFGEGTATNEKLATAISLRTETLQQVSSVCLQLQRDIAGLADVLKGLTGIVLDIQREHNAREAAWQVRQKQIEETLSRNGSKMESLLEELRRGR